MYCSLPRTCRGMLHALVSKLPVLHDVSSSSKLVCTLSSMSFETPTHVCLMGGRCLSFSTSSLKVSVKTSGRAVPKQ